MIRNAQPGEIRILHRIDRICFAAALAYSLEELRFYMEQPHSLTKVAERDGVPVGFAVGWSLPGGRAHIITLDVVPEARRLGAGTMLMDALHREFRRLGLARADLEVDAGNEGARLFYERLGYRRTRLLAGYYRDGRDAYRMTRKL